jgi:excinuclease ABC subunit B
VFEVDAPYQKAGDQPQAVERLTAALQNGEKWVTLHGITGSGKSATMAWTIQNLQRPALVMAPNKSLAAQLAGELKELMPTTAVCFFVSYYDYYQPEAYVASSDMFIEKEAVVNAEIDRLRHEATCALLSRRDVVVVASVSCIYGLGNPDTYRSQMLVHAVGDEVSPEVIARSLVARGFERNDVDVARGKFRVRGDVMDIHPAHTDKLWRVEFFGDTIERIREIDALSGDVLHDLPSIGLFPANHYTAQPDATTSAISRIEAELEGRLEVLNEDGKLLEAQRLAQRTGHDIDMLRETNTCAGVENYSRHMDGRAAGERPYTLLDYFPADFIVFADESHVAIPQIRGSWAGDASRKATLIEHGFRLPSAADNRPLRFEEFESVVPQVVLVSATPGEFEKTNSQTVVELVVRPTGLLDPPVTVRPQLGQLDDLLSRVLVCVERKERVLVTAITKKSAEDLTGWFLDRQVRARFLHSDVETLERIALIRELRLGAFDVLVGVNLLREGLDIPECSLVAILDADTQGFLRSETSLIQTIGRAARNVNGEAVLYANTVTPAMSKAIEETVRRRKKQQEYNTLNGITPTSITSEVRELLAQKAAKDPSLHKRRQAAPLVITSEKMDAWAALDDDGLQALVITLELEMLQAAESLHFELAARLRDELRDLDSYIQSLTT